MLAVSRLNRLAAAAGEGDEYERENDDWSMTDDR